MKNNLEGKIAYTYRIKSFEEINGTRFAVCDILKDNIELPLPHYFPYDLVEKHNLIHIGDKFSFSKYEDGVPKSENLRVIYRKEKKKYTEEYNHNGSIFPLH
ncbi:MAG: hypothetical protein Q8N88_01675 [Nanoarchaeota archaeon]|nr:hypothetical protein [Nanoarchaeota archaeon]